MFWVLAIHLIFADGKITIDLPYNNPAECHSMADSINKQPDLFVWPDKNKKPEAVAAQCSP